MEKYVMIEYEGEYDIVVAHIKEKIESIKNDIIFPVGNKIYTKILNDDEDDLFFFRNYEITESPKTRYISMEHTTREDYLQKKEEHLETQRQTTKPTPPVDQQFNEIKSNVPEVVNPYVVPKSINNPSQSSQVVQGTDMMSNILGAIQETVLPAKQPLQKEDPFNFMISRDFIVLFMFLSLLVVNLMSIMG